MTACAQQRAAAAATRLWLESHGVLVLHRLFTAIATRTFGAGTAGWGPHFAALTCRLAAQLASRLAIENWCIFASCASWAA